MAEPSNAPGPTPPSRGPFACRLALKLVKNRLGPVCQQALECLIDRGTQQYSELQRTSGLPPPQLRTALLVLIQHNLVSCYLREEPPTLRGPGPSYALYEAALPRVLQILREPRFLTHITDEHGSLAARLLRTLMEQGRLRWSQLLQAVTQELEAEAEAAAEGDPEAASGSGGGEAAPPPSPDVLLNTFRSLVLERYIERVPPCTLPPPPQQVHAAARKKKAVPKPGSEEEAGALREQAEELLWREHQQERFKLSEDLAGAMKVAGEEGGNSKPAGKRKRGKDAVVAEPAKKRGRWAEREEEAAQVAGAKGQAPGDGAAPVLWRVNNDEFNRRFRNDVIVAFIKQKHGSDAARAVEGVLLANAPFEHGALAGDSIVLGVNEVAAALRRVHGDVGVPEDLAAILGDLTDEDMGFLSPMGNGPAGAQFTLAIPQVLRFARLVELQAVVRRKFGVYGQRIWRLLLLQGQLEQKQVADLAMVTKEEAREALYAMLKAGVHPALDAMPKAGYLALQDVPRTADHAPSRTFYTWRANADAAITRLAADLYRAAGNLHARMAFEGQRQAELLALAELPDVAPSVLERRQDEIERFKALMGRLAASLLELDAQICIFADV